MTDFRLILLDHTTYVKLALSAQAISQNIEKKTFPLGISKKWLFYMYFDFDDTTQC